MSVSSEQVVRSRPWRDGWIFSRNWDLVLFGGAVIFVLLLAPVGALLGLESDSEVGWTVRLAGIDFALRVGMLIDFLYHILIDGPHALATVYRVYLDPEEFPRRKWFYVLTPLLVFGVFSPACYFYPLAALRFVSYLNLFHYIRQQFGWVMVSGHKGGGVTRRERQWDSFAIYAATICPVLWWHANPTEDGWLFDGDLLRGLPSIFGNLALAVLAVSVVLYIWELGRRWQSGAGINRGQLFLWLITLFAWDLGIFLNLTGERTFMLDIQHAVPYLGFVFFYGHRKWASKNAGGWRALFFSRRTWFLYYMPLVVFAALTWQIGLYVRDGHGSLSAALLLAAILVPPVTHYLFDGFVWRTGPANPGLAETLAITRDGTVRDHEQDFRSAQSLRG